MYYTVYRGELKSSWGEANCKCPTHGLDNGFDPVGDEQQWSGLTDKHNVKMFEGDIMEHVIETPEGFRLVRGEMYFNNSKAQFGVDMEVLEGDRLGNHFEVRESISGRPTVIGNNWENPNLIKK